MNISDIILAAEEAIQTQQSEGVLGTLGINWKLFIAQLVNFVIVLFVFWKWIVKPLGKTLTSRQEKIERGLKNAALTEEEKKKFEIWKKDEMKRVRNEADQIMRITNDTANKVKQETIIEAQKQADKLIKQAEASIRAEKEQAVKEIKQEVATLVVAASEKILRGKLDSRKDHELIGESLSKTKP